MKKLTPADDFATRPIALPAATARDRHANGDSPRICAEHGWTTSSRHSTSLGTVVYSSCASCGAHRAELLAPFALMAEPISHEVGLEPVHTDPSSPHPSLG